MFKPKWLVDFTMTLCQRSLESKLEVMQVVPDENEKNEIRTHIKELNKKFSRVAKNIEFVVKDYKEYLFGLLIVLKVIVKELVQ